MTYSIELRFHPIYELLNSLHVYLHANFYKKSDLGANWRKATMKKLSKELAEALESEQIEHLSYLNGYLFSQELGTAPIEQLLQELSKKEEEEVIDYFVNQLDILEDKLKPRIGTFHNSLHLVKRWHDEYFQQMDPFILTSLEIDIEQKRKLLGKEEPNNFVEKVTNGLVLRGFSEVKKVVLYPVYHASPIITFSQFPQIHYYGYPVDLIPSSTEEPSPSLIRRSVALTDKNRLQILRYLVHSERSFTEIVKYIGLAKSTVHHHLISLRAAGLVQVIMSPHSSERFRLREEGLKYIFQDYERYLFSDQNKS